MAGLPCEACQEETIVLSNGEPGTDGEGRTIYRRYRVCVNQNCERCGEVVETVEIALPRPDIPRVVSSSTLKRLQKYGLYDSSQPSLFSDL